MTIALGERWSMRGERQENQKKEGNHLEGRIGANWSGEGKGWRDKFYLFLVMGNPRLMTTNTVTYGPLCINRMPTYRGCLPGYIFHISKL